MTYALRLLVPLLLIPLLALAAACGNGDDNDATPTPGTPTPTGTPGTPTTATPDTATPELTPTPPPATATPTPTPTPIPPTPTPTTAPATPSPSPNGDVTILPCNDPLVPVDRERRLPADCVPPDLVTIRDEFSMSQQYVRAETAENLHQMLEDARAAGHEIVVRSAYRSYELQDQIFHSLADSIGWEAASRRSAYPGHSEHQLGTTVDVTNAAVGYELDQAFADTAAGQWLQENAWQYGFVMSYPEGTEHITGYVFEPWHWRYVGIDIAQRIVEGGHVPGQYLLDIYNP